MASNHGPKGRLIFGPFELDVAAGELLKNGVRIRLPRQPFQILCYLLANPAKVVTREELRDEIWGNGTFVDFDHGLNVAMNRLRGALNDSAEKPRYIETVPGRGYRFIGSLQIPEAVTAEASVPVTASSEFQTTPLTAIDQAPKAGWRSHRKGWTLVIASLALLAFTCGFFYFGRKPALTSEDTIVLADFVNKTDDLVFSDALRQGLTVELQQSPFLNLVSDERIRQTLRLMGRPADARLSPELGLEVCERTGSAALLEGSIVTLGSQYVLWLRARSCGNASVLYEEQVQAARKEDVLNALSQIARRFRKRAGESAAAIEKHATPLAEASTPSIEALKAYSTARKVAFANSYDAAIPHLKRAINLDPKFAMAYAYLGRTYGDIGESVLSAENTVKAYQLRDRTTDRERFFITFTYDRQVTGNLEKAQQTAEMWVQAYPREIDAHTLLAGLCTQGTGRYERSIAEAKKALDLEPYSVPGFANLAYANFYTDRPLESENALRLAAQRKLEIPDYLMLRYYIAFLKGDQAGMDREIARTEGQPGAEDWMCHNRALVLAHSGQLRQARVMSRRAVTLAQHSGERERAALYEAGAAIYEASLGNPSEAKQRAAAALLLSKGRDIEYGAAFALALSGDYSSSQKLVIDLTKRYPEDTSVQFSYLPVLRAQLALARGDDAKALEVLQVANPYELALPGTTFFGFFGGLYPVYLRGEAYLREHRGAEAIVEFEKFVKHRGLVFADPVDILAHLELARAFNMVGDKASAQKTYTDFLKLWKDADPDNLILERARKEYVKTGGL